MARVDHNNIARYWRDPHIPGLSLMHADFTTQEYSPHFHDAIVIAATELGGSVITSRGAVQQADATALFVFNPGEPQASRMGASRRWRYRSVYLEQNAIDHVSLGLGIDQVPYFTRNLHYDRDLMGAFILLHQLLQEGGEVLQQRELLIATFGTLFRRHGSGGRPIERGPRDRARLRRAVELIGSRITETLTLQDIAAALGLTEYQLIGLFKRTSGLTPHAYITQVRLEIACRELSAGQSIAAAAAAAGFYDQSALTRHFKQRLGITPLQFVHASRI